MSVRRLLLTLELSAGRADVDERTLEELFRHFHSLKGISGMVELRPAENLAHRMEEYLRALAEARGHALDRGRRRLFDGTQMLEQIVGAHRSGSARSGDRRGLRSPGRRAPRHAPAAVRQPGTRRRRQRRVAAAGASRSRRRRRWWRGASASTRFAGGSACSARFSTPFRTSATMARSRSSSRSRRRSTRRSWPPSRQTA